MKYYLLEAIILGGAAAITLLTLLSIPTQGLR